MSDNSGSVPTIVCPVCHHKKHPMQHALTCGDCVHHDTELVRNSVVENERRNEEMRAQIDLIFGICNTLNGKSNISVKATTLPENDSTSTLAAGVSDAPEFPQPGENAIVQLALHLQKLEILNSKMKARGLLISRDTIVKKNSALEQKIETLTRTLEQGQRLIEKQYSSMLERYSRKLEHLDRDIIAVQCEAMRRVSRQTALAQYANYKVIREKFFSASSSETNFRFCSWPVLRISSFLDTQIHTINTFLEDLISLQLVLFDLCRIEDETLELPYLEYLRKLLPDRKFFDAVQLKINTFLPLEQHESSAIDDPQNVGPENGNPQCVSGEPLSEDLRPTFEKITIKGNLIRVPKSFRTMNLQRRFSVKDTEGMGDEMVSETSEQHFKTGKSSAFIMVAQEHTPGSDNGSLKKNGKIPQSKERISPNTSGNQENNTKKPTETSINNESAFHPNFNKKRIVIVPHRILTKPFSKLRPNEYLKFVSIIVKILVTLNDFLRKVLGPLFAERTPNSHTMPLLSSSIMRARLEGELAEKGPYFLYDFKEILRRFANMDEFFERKLHPQFQTSENVLTNTQASHSLDASQMTNITEDSKSMPNSFTNSPESALGLIPLSGFLKIKDFYSRFISKNKGPELRPELASVSDDIIYGLVSESTAKGGTNRIKKDKENNVRGNYLLKLENQEESRAFDLKEILKRVHDLFSGSVDGSSSSSKGLYGGNGPVHQTTSDAHTMMQQSKAHLDDWDVVSKMV